MIPRPLERWRRAHPAAFMITLLWGLALVVRLWMVGHTYVIAKDGILYVTLAQHFSLLQFKEGLAHVYHPLYPLLIALFHIPIGDWELAGQLVSALFGSLTVIPLSDLARRLFHDRAAWLTGLLVAIHPYLVRISAEVLSDATYIFFFVSSVALGWRCLEEGKSRWAFLMGLACAAAYLVRPEGIGVLLVGLGWVILVRPWWKPQLPPRRILHVSASLLLAFSFVAGPYLVYLRQETGAWRLTKKKDVEGVLGLEEIPSHYKEKFQPSN